MNTFVDIVQKLIAPATFMRQEGIPIHAYVTELTWLLFWKIAPALDKASYLPTVYRWENLIDKPLEDKFEYYQKFITEMGKVSEPIIAGIYAYACTTFKHPEQLAEVISTLSLIDGIDTEDLGEVYEILLEKCAYQDGSRLLIPPRSLVDTMVILTQPQLGELIQDPLASTANVIVAADQYMQLVHDAPMENQNRKINQKADIIAVEPDLVRQRLALMNCILHQIDQTQPLPVRWGDSLLSNLQHWPQADVILSLLVFASEHSDQLDKHDGSLALLQHIYQTLKPGGRAAVVLPDKVLKARGPAQQVRTTLLDTCILHTVLRLPHGIFYPHKVQAHLLFFRRGQSSDEKTEKVWFYDLRTDLPIFGQYLHLTRDYLRTFEKLYGEERFGQAQRAEEGEKGRWRCFNREHIAKEDDRLDLCWLQDEKATTSDNAVAEKIWDVLDNTMADLEALANIL
jgi:type I restriction enzyme M protein